MSEMNVSSSAAPSPSAGGPSVSPRVQGSADKVSDKALDIFSDPFQYPIRADSETETNGAYTDRFKGSSALP